MTEADLKPLPCHWVLTTAARCAHACPTAAIEYVDTDTVDWIGDFAAQRFDTVLAMEGAR